MKTSRLNAIGMALLVVVSLALGCSHHDAPLEPLSSAELAPALEKAFTKAKPEVRDLITQAITAVQAQDYSKAFLQLNKLQSQPDLTQEQSTVLARGILTLNGLLQSAQSKGDANAAQTLKNYDQNK
jgi:hypothetical protein